MERNFHRNTNLYFENIMTNLLKTGRYFCIFHLRSLLLSDCISQRKTWNLPFWILSAVTGKPRLAVSFSKEDIPWSPSCGIMAT
jgi:hypothetical protein